MAHIHFIGGEKGGVGKSLVARILAQYLIDVDLVAAISKAHTAAEAELKNIVTVGLAVCC